MTQDEQDGAIRDITEALHAATAETRGLREDVKVLDAKRGRDISIFKGAIALVLIATAMSAFVALTNRPILDLIKSTVEPTGEINQRSQAASAVLVQNLPIEIDCRQRRALADLPPPAVQAVVLPDGRSAMRQAVPCALLPDNPVPFNLVSNPPLPDHRGDGGGSRWWPYLAIAAFLGLPFLYLRWRRGRAAA